jgi:hypothetical protein
MPDGFHERSARNDLAGPLDEDNEQIESAADDDNGLAVLLQSALSREEAEWTECKHGIATVGHS